MPVEFDCDESNDEGNYFNIEANEFWDTLWFTPKLANAY